jgi:hypothetical protein
MNIYCIVVKIVLSIVLRTSPVIRRNALAGTVGVGVGVIVGVLVGVGVMVGVGVTVGVEVRVIVGVGVGVLVIVGVGVTVGVGVIVGVGVGVGPDIFCAAGEPPFTTLLNDNLLLIDNRCCLARSVKLGGLAMFKYLYMEPSSLLYTILGCNDFSPNAG